MARYIYDKTKRERQYGEVGNDSRRLPSYIALRQIESILDLVLNVFKASDSIIHKLSINFFCRWLHCVQAPLDAIFTKLKLNWYGKCYYYISILNFLDRIDFLHLILDVGKEKLCYFFESFCVFWTVYSLTCAIWSGLVL